MNKLTKNIMLVLGCTFFIGLLFLWLKPPLSIFYFGGALFFGFIILSVSGTVLFCLKGAEKAINGVICLFSVWLVISFLYGAVYGGDFWRDADLRKQIGVVKELKFDEHILPIAKGKLPLVDMEYAKLLGEKKLGEDPGLGSQVVAGKYTLQSVDGELVWIAPLEHKDMWRWLFNDGTPGYIRVSANDSRDVRLVQEVSGKKINLKYLESACFAENIEMKAMMINCTKGLTGFNFEVDDDGKPYWVVTIYENFAAWDNPDAIGVIVIDAQTGISKTYDVQNVPEWVDNVYPAKMVMNQIENWGDYINGYFNPSNEGKLEPSEGYSEVYNTIHSDKGGNYYYTGITSIGKDESTTGILLVNKRTKEVIRYNISGATEMAARRSAMGQVQEKEYVASFPVLTVVRGVPAYFMLLKDAAGLVKLYALVSVQEHQFVGIGETLESVERNFIKTLTTTANAVNFANQMEVSERRGEIIRISSNVENGASFYYFTLDVIPHVIYKASSQISLELVLSKMGDSVQIKYLAPNDGYADVIEFHNWHFMLQKSEETQKLEKINKENRAIK